MGQYDDEDDLAKKPRFRLMHFTMIMLGLLFISKVSEVATAADELFSVRDAQASSEAPKEEAAKAEEEHAADVKEEEKAKEEAHDEAAKEEKASASDEKAKAEETHDEAAKEEEGGHDEEGKPKGPEMTQGAGKLTIKEVEALKAKEAGSPYTQSELDLLTNLTKRRNELDEREKELEIKNKVLDATELRITNKVNEMKLLEAELGKVVAQYKTQQNTEIGSLVKIYENMKPSAAANIFNQMEMPILLEVIDKMSVRKVAPILAGMDPKKARDVTQELAEMRRGRAALTSAADAAIKPPAAN